MPASRERACVSKCSRMCVISIGLTVGLPRSDTSQTSVAGLMNGIIANDCRGIVMESSTSRSGSLVGRTWNGRSMAPTDADDQLFIVPSLQRISESPSSRASRKGALVDELDEPALHDSLALPDSTASRYSGASEIAATVSVGSNTVSSRLPMDSLRLASPFALSYLRSTTFSWPTPIFL